MNDRQELQAKLVDILGSNDVYYQPPESIKLKYPCIVYHLADIRIDNADDVKYRKYSRYTVTYITKNAEDRFIDKLMDAFDYCSFDRTYSADHLIHYVVTIFMRRKS